MSPREVYRRQGCMLADGASLRARVARLPPVFLAVSEISVFLRLAVVLHFWLHVPAASIYLTGRRGKESAR